nr:ribonuclease H-like domain-containing protein [Tanacetum cinerariifolium]
MQKSILKQKFEEFKIFEEEGLDKGYDKMQKILTQMNTLKIKPEPEYVNMKFLRGLPPSWSGIPLILKTKGGLEYISFDDLYNKLTFLEIDTKGYSSSSSTLSNAAFVTGIKIVSYADSEGKVVSADNTIPAGVSIFAIEVAVVVVSPQSKTEFALMGLSTEAKWNNSGKNLYKLIDSSMSVRTKRGLGLDQYIREGKFCIDDSKFSISTLTVMN